MTQKRKIIQSVAVKIGLAEIISLILLIGVFHLVHTSKEPSHVDFIVDDSQKYTVRFESNAVLRVALVVDDQQMDSISIMNDAREIRVE